MKIKNIYIKSFGKLKDLNLDFNDGLNIIYGSNESGKSTIQHFIKTMFYGMNSQKRAIADNERKKYIPWYDNRAEGRLTFQDERGREYVIERTFGATKKEDHTVVYDFITGQEALHLDNYQPGRDLFGLGEDAFEKTLFIKQLGAKVAMDKEDEIMKKLSNIQESGQEDLSYNKAKLALENYKKSLRGSRKQGKIDILEDKIMSLKMEQQELELLHRSNLEDSKLLQENLNKIRILEQNLEQVLKRKRDIKNTSMESEKERIFKDKYYDGTIKEAEDLIYKASETFVIYKERYEALKVIEEEAKKLKSLLEREKEELNHYEGFQLLEENVDKKLNILAMEKKELENLMQQQSLLEEEIKALQSRISYLNSEFQEDAKLLNITIEEENTIIRLEEKLQHLSYAIESKKIKDNRELKKDILKDKRKNFKFLILVGSLISLAIIYGAVSRNLTADIIGFVGILMGIYGYSQYKRATKELQIIAKAEANSDGLLLKEKREVEEKLKELYSKYHVESYMDLKNKLDSCRSTISTLEGINISLKEKELQLDKLRITKAWERLDKIQKYFEKIFKQCDCSNMEHFYIRLKEYRELQFAINKLQEQYKSKIDEVEKKLIAFTSAEKELKHLLSNFKNFNDNMYNLNYCQNFIEDLKEALDNIKEAQEKEDKKLNELVDSLDEQIAELNRKIIESKELKKDIEHKIETRFKDKRQLWMVEEEIEQCREQIAKLKNLYEASKIASTVLDEAFQEVQSNFIPNLNAEVANILSSITKGKYNKVRVSPADNYQIKVLQEESLRSLDFLSGGTFDQVYFSLRLALSNLIFKKSNVPIFLDDAFIQYDESRLHNAMEFLQEYSKEHQVIIFTCRKLPVKETVNLDSIS